MHPGYGARPRRDDGSARRELRREPAVQELARLLVPVGRVQQHDTEVDRPAAGANFTAAAGVGYGDFPGDFNPATSAYEGQYELALGGLFLAFSIRRMFSSRVPKRDSMPRVMGTMDFIRRRARFYC